MDLKVTLSPLVLNAFKSKTGTLRAPGIWVESGTVTPTVEMATSGWVGVAVGVFVGLLDGVLVGVIVAVFVRVFVGLLVAVGVGVFVAVFVGVGVGVLVGVIVGVLVGVFVGVLVGVLVGVSVDVFVGLLVTVGVAVAALTVWVFPVTVPDRIAPWPLTCPPATMDVLLIALLNVLFARPATFRSNTSSKVIGWLLLTVTTPLAALAKVTDPPASKVWFPNNRVSVTLLKSPLEPGELSWYSFTLPATTSAVQLKLPAPLKANCLTTTFSWEEADRITWTLEAFSWLKE
jgi:hypothetical protein